MMFQDIIISWYTSGLIQTWDFFDVGVFIYYHSPFLYSLKLKLPSCYAVVFADDFLQSFR